MKYCEKCGNQLLDEAVMCPKCGYTITKPTYTKEQEEQSKIQARATWALIGSIAIIVITILLVMAQLNRF